MQRKFASSLAGAALLFALGQGHALAATINVGGGCSLIDAITAANTDSATGGCSAGSGADTIVLAASSTHTLTSINNSTYGPTGLPVINSAITIEGNGSTITRDSAAPEFRLIAINGTGDLTVQDATLSGGRRIAAGTSLSRSGGGLLNFFGQLRLEGCTISGNTAARGAGVWSRASGSSTLSIVNSTISGNSGDSVGGVWIDTDGSSTLNIIDSTISGNTAGSEGGGVWSYTDDSSTVSLVNSTISGNTAGSEGGGVWSHIRFTGHTVTVALHRSLIAGNTATGSGDEVRRADTVGNFLVDDSNLFGHAGVSTADALSGFSTGLSDITATADGNNPTALADILDTTLQNNGGPTLTHALVAGSPAIDASPADADCPATDQRGVARPQGVACDIGAFEVLSAVAEVCGNCVDDDGDGKIDLADSECATNPLTVSKGSFTFKPDPNKDQILLTAQFPSAGVTLNPPVDGVTISFFDADGGIECFVIPPNSPGWKVNGTGTVWSFKDLKDNSLGDPQAEEKVKIRQNGATFDITLDIKEAEVIDPDAGPIASGIVIGEQRRLNQQPWTEKTVGKKLVTP